MKHWRSKCCKNIARKAPADPVFCGGLGISGKGCVKSVSDLFQKKIDIIFSILCEATTVYPGAEMHYAVVNVYESLEGNANIISVTDEYVS